MRKTRKTLELHSDSTPCLKAGIFLRAFSMTSSRQRALPVAGLVVVAALLAGCTDIEQALNKGGDTPCSDYVKQDQDTQRMTVTKFIKQQSGNQHEPAGTAVDATMVSVNFLCSNQRNTDTPIRNANVVGIFFNTTTNSN
jgi:acid stress chaperone HdeA